MLYLIHCVMGQQKTKKLKVWNVTIAYISEQRIYLNCFRLTLAVLYLPMCIIKHRSMKVYGGGVFTSCVLNSLNSEIEIVQLYWPDALAPVKQPFINWLGYLLTPWSRVLLEKLTGSQLVNNFPIFYVTLKFITSFTSFRNLSLSVNSDNVHYWYFFNM
jgi:hypothetical protein